jgi:multiple sugar transport system permease protein
MDAKRTLSALVGLLLLGLMLSFVLGPFAWQLITALKPEAQLAQLPPLLPSPPTGQHFAAVLDAPGFLRVAWNSILVAAATVALAFLLGVPASYALAKLQVRARNPILGTLLCLSMFPAIANVAPLYLLFIRLGLRDNPLAIVLAHSVFALPFAIWMLTTFSRKSPTTSIAPPALTAAPTSAFFATWCCRWPPPACSASACWSLSSRGMNSSTPSP